MKKIFTILVVLFYFANATQAQYFSYLASKAKLDDAGVYTDLGTTGTKITTNFNGAPMGTLDDNSSVQQIGFPFNFSGFTFSSFVLNTNGFIRLGTQPTAMSAAYDVLFSTDTTATNVIYPFNINLQPTAITEFRVASAGTIGNRTCTIQFKALKDSGCPVNCTPPSLIQYDNIDFQIILYEDSNKIEFVYGNFIANANASGFVPTNAGIKLNAASRSLNVSKSSQSQYNIATFIDGGYTGNRFNTRNSILPTAGFTIKFVPIDVLTNNVKIQANYIVGKTPKLYDNSFSVLLQNVSKTNFTNYPVTLNVTGANTLNNVQTVNSLNAGEKVLVTFPTFSWPNVGLNNLIVSLPADDDLQDNTDSIKQTVTALTIGTCQDTFTLTSVGSNAGTIDMCARFKNPISNKITSLAAYISGAGRVFRYYVYTVDADTPRAKLHTSANITSVLGKNTYTLPTPITVTGDFFVVITQLSASTNLGLRYKAESPIRTKTFFFRSPSGANAPPSSAWFDAANSTLPAKFLIDATMQTAYLPIKLTYFNGVKEGKTNVLKWETANEINNQGFEIERSADGKEFNKIGYKESNAKNGNSSNLLTYNFIDNNPFLATNYYRLKQIDKDGETTYSNIVAIIASATEKTSILSLFPNPSNLNTNIVINSITAENLSITITDLMGKSLSINNIAAVKGINKISLQTTNFASGTYLIKVINQSNQDVATTKFVKL